jgi:quercetin dioxygenase-like cupin family protein
MTLEKKEIAPGFVGRFFTRPEHSHNHEQVVHLISGNFELIVEGQRFELGPRALFTIPRNARHSGSAITDCVILDTFYPVQEDYCKGTAIGFKTS